MHASFPGEPRLRDFFLHRDRIPYMFTLRAAHVLSEPHSVVLYYFRHSSLALLLTRRQSCTLNAAATVTISNIRG